MPSSRLALREEDVVRLSLEFLYNRELHISQLSLERETGVINGQYSDDILFLRQLILDGQWDDVIEFIQPLEALNSFDMKHFRYTILRHKYIELLCIKSEAGTALPTNGNSVEGAVEEVVQILAELEKLTPTKEDYSALCLLLTLPRLADHLHYRDWNPSKARVQCFREVFPLVEKFLPGDKKTNLVPFAKNDRLVQLLIKGVLYESCVNYCQSKATGQPGDDTSQEMAFSKFLDGSIGFSDSDLSLLSWLQSIPTETFSVPFEQRTLNVDVERLERPTLETSWTEHMLITPIKPKTFPHSVMPFTRPRSAADIMSRSLLPTLDGLPYGLNPNLPNISNEGVSMSRSSFASFHLTGIKTSSGKVMTSSVDRLFENDADVFHSSNFQDFQGLPSIQETTSVQSKSPEPAITLLNKNVAENLVNQSTGRDSPNTSTAKSSRRDSLSEKHMSDENLIKSSPQPPLTHPPAPQLHFSHPLYVQPISQPLQTTNNIQSQIPILSQKINTHNNYNIQTEEHNEMNRIKSSPPIVGDHNTSSGGGELFEKFQKQKLIKENNTVANGNSNNNSNNNNKKNGASEIINTSAIKQDPALNLKGPDLHENDPLNGGGDCDKIAKYDRQYATSGSNIAHSLMKRDRQYTRSGSSNGHHGMTRDSKTAMDKYQSCSIVASANNNNNNNQNGSKICFCRSRSMEDFRSDLQVDWQQQSNNNMNNNNNSSNNNNNILKQLNGHKPPIHGGGSNGGGNGGTGAGHHHHHHHLGGSLKKYLGRSMDNINENDSIYGKNYQILPTTDPNRPKFVAVTTLEDVQAVRCAEFHPNGKVYAVGSNSKTFRICEYPSLSEIREEHTTYQPTVLFKRTKHHKGSIYCMAWSPQGDLVATGSNDKTVKLMRYNDIQKQLEGRETELTMHDGTVRDLCFIEDSSNQSSLLISGGAGDCKIYVTDCATSTPFQALSGHGGHVLSLYNWGGAMFVSGSQDKTVRFWDLRTRGCVNMVTPATVPGSRQGSPVASVCVDPSGRLLVSGHEDSSCVLYDIRGNRPIQCFKPHSSDIRSIRFSPSAYYLLTGGYDNKLVLTDLQGDLTLPLPSVVVAQHTDKIISGRWHPTDFSFISTSADKTATLWALPPI